MRVIKVYSTEAKDLKSFDVPATVTTWGDLEAILVDGGVNTKDKTVKVRETEVNLESSMAQIPTTDFTLFLFPKKVKSGVRDSKGRFIKKGKLTAEERAEVNLQVSTELSTMREKITRILEKAADKISKKIEKECARKAEAQAKIDRQKEIERLDAQAEMSQNRN